MIALNFEINAPYIAYHTIINCAPNRFLNNVPDEKIVRFQNAAWSIDKQANNFLRFGITDVSLITTSSIGEIAQRAEQLIQQMVEHETFAPLLEETTSSLELVKSEWESNSAQTHEIVSDLTGLDLTGNFQIYLTHPTLKQGHYLDEIKAVCWAYRNDWPNYNTVYIWHELLHSFIPGADLEHAVIQLIADNELRIRLNGGTYPPFEGHPYLTNLMESLLPNWQHYIESKDKNIIGFLTKIQGLQT